MRKLSGISITRPSASSSGFPNHQFLYILDCDEQGWDLSQSIEFAKILKQLGVHLVDCSSGGNLDVTKYPGVYQNVDQIPMAAAIQREAQIATGAVGGIIAPQWAETILQQGMATLIFIGRVSLYDPHWPHHAAYELNVSGKHHEMPGQYGWAIGKKSSSNWRQKTFVERNRKLLEEFHKVKE